MYYALNLRKTHLIKGHELSTDEGNWCECSGDELWAMNLRQSNFVVQGDKSDRRAGEQIKYGSDFNCKPFISLMYFTSFNSSN